MKMMKFNSKNKNAFSLYRKIFYAACTSLLFACSPKNPERIEYGPIGPDKNYYTLTGTLEKVTATQNDMLQSYFYLKLPNKITVESEDDSCGKSVDLNNIDLWYWGFNIFDDLKGKTLTIRGKIDCPRGSYVFLDIDKDKHDGAKIDKFITAERKKFELEEKSDAEAAKNRGFATVEKMREANELGIKTAHEFELRNKLKTLEWYALPAQVYEDIKYGGKISKCIKDNPAELINLQIDLGNIYRTEEISKIGDIVLELKVHVNSGYIHYIRGLEQCSTKIDSIQQEYQANVKQQKNNADRYK